MKKITLILAILGLGAVCAKAQTIADNESNLRNYFWFTTNNAAALSARAMDVRNDLSIVYTTESGGMHMQQDPQSLNDVSLHTSGSGKVGSLVLWGDFKFQNRFEEGSRYNAIRYQIDEDMPYYVADTCFSPWTKQAYLMSVKVASPLLWDLVTFGVKADYNARVGAKQKDPRCATYKHDVSIYPSATFTLGKSIFGVYAFYTNGFERSVPSNENYRKDQTVFITTGLGEGKTSRVGGNDGIGTVFYRKNVYGGGFEYNHMGSESDVFAELVYSNTAESAFEKPGMPKPFGRISRNTINANFTGLFGETKSHKAVFDAVALITTGTEQIISRNDTPGNPHWDVVAENAMSNFFRVNAHLGYDYLAKADGHYDWSAGGDVRFSMRDYSYLIPADKFNAMGVVATANGGKQLFFGDESALSVKAEAGYHQSLGGQYIYTGGDKTKLIQAMYHKDIAFLTSNYMLAGARVSYTIKSKKFSYNIDLTSQYMKSSTADRFVAQLSAGILF